MLAKRKAPMSSTTSSNMFQSFKLAEQCTTQRGAKYGNLSNNGSKVTIFPTVQAVVTPFGPGNFDKDVTATRLTLEPASYKHLRAHETAEHRVCRLLLEKKQQQTHHTLTQ